MGFLSSLFSKKEVIQEVKEEPAYELLENSELICDRCGQGIFAQQKVKSFNAKKYHLKPCWRQIQKDAMAVYKGNKIIQK